MWLAARFGAIAWGILSEAERSEVALLEANEDGAGERLARMLMADGRPLTPTDARAVLCSVEQTHYTSGHIDCPWCGRAHGNLSEYDWSAEEDDSIEIDCACGSMFSLRRTIRVSYTATPLLVKP